MLCRIAVMRTLRCVVVATRAPDTRLVPFVWHLIAAVTSARSDAQQALLPAALDLWLSVLQHIEALPHYLRTSVDPSVALVSPAAGATLALYDLSGNGATGGVDPDVWMLPARLIEHALQLLVLAPEYVEVLLRVVAAYVVLMEPADLCAASPVQSVSERVWASLGALLQQTFEAARGDTGDEQQERRGRERVWREVAVCAQVLLLCDARALCEPCASARALFASFAVPPLADCGGVFVVAEAMAARWRPHAVQSNNGDIGAHCGAIIVAASSAIGAGQRGVVGELVCTPLVGRAVGRRERRLGPFGIGVILYFVGASDDAPLPWRLLVLVFTRWCRIAVWSPQG